MSMKTAKVYAVQKVGPINIGAGNNDYIHKAFGRIQIGPGQQIAIVTAVSPATYESLAKALLDRQEGEVVVDPSQVLGVEVVGYAGGPEDEAIAAVRARSVRTT